MSLYSYFKKVEKPSNKCSKIVDSKNEDKEESEEFTLTKVVADWSCQGSTACFVSHTVKSVYI